MMKLYVDLMVIFVFSIVPVILAANFNMTCYYDTFSVKRLGIARFTNKDLEYALPLCDNIIYGYVGIHPETFRVSIINQLQIPQFALIKTLKTSYRNVKFILSLGGDRDFPNHDDKYLKLLEATDEVQQRFIQSAREFVLKYQFDGFDLAYQLPRRFTNTDSRKTALHRHQMTRLINKFRLAFKKDKLSLTLTVLPNIDAKIYYNVTAIIKSLDFVTLAAFDFSLPHITPHEANYLAPIHATPNGPARLHHANVDYNLQQWTWTKQVPTKKLNLGIAVFGRTWNTTTTLKNPRMPITSLLNGPAPGGPNTRTSGLLAWPEICKKLPKISVVSKQMFGNFAYRPGLTKRDQGLLIIYESPNSLVEKTVFAQRNKLRGVALFDLTLDDFRGKCRGKRYVMLKTIKGKLN